MYPFFRQTFGGSGIDQVLDPTRKRMVVTPLNLLTALGPRFGAGELADLYENLGGSVIRIGKPYPAIYEAALALAGNPDRERVVCVGDSIEHDIAGGVGAGVATALVLCGILADTGDLTGLFEEPGAHPDYVLNSFRWSGK